jgi:assimilatory nitrate reductase electron transfer subunit
MTSKKRVVVIGGGMAASRLALRLGTPAAEDAVHLTVIGEEPHPPYSRVLLAEVLAGRYAPEVISLPQGAGSVDRLTGVRAVRVDRAARRVRCDDGWSVPYDVLVLATGSNPVLPPLRGLFDDRPLARSASAPPERRELPHGVHALRTLDDCLAVGEAATRPDARTVVVGGGLLGVSAARALAERGVHVVLAHQGTYLMERQLDPGASELLERHLGELGVEVHTACRVRGLHTRREAAEPGTRSVESVQLADGYRLGCETLVLACGVRPRTGLARAAGLEVARGIVVDDRLRTWDPRVHAIGDCAEHAGTVYGLAGAAQEQADVLARVLTGDRGPDGGLPRYRGTRALTRLTLPARRQALPAVGPAPAHARGLDLAAFGEPVARGDDDVVKLTDATRSVYRKAVVRGDRLVGGILLGDLEAVGTLARTWEGDEALPTAPLLQLLTSEGGH